MSIEVASDGGGLRARCDGCDRLSARIEAASTRVAEQIVHAAGWRTLDAQTTYCPRCGGAFRGRTLSGG